MTPATSPTSPTSPLMDVASRRTLVVVDDLVQTALPDRIAALKARGASIEAVSYRRLGDYTERLRQIVRERHIDFVLFARNDQVFERVSIGPLIRALGVGYSSFSGIDTPDYLEQTRACLDDYLSGTARLGPLLGASTRVPPEPHTPPVGETFSLLFDLEQLGGARFGLPRILDVLDARATTATFFTTNVIQEVYADAPELLTTRGHEVGLHGLCHEYLAGRPCDEQRDLIGHMKTRFGPRVPVVGANFIGRMDASTVTAMIENGLTYWVQFMEHSYAPFSYRTMPLRPLPVWIAGRSMWVVPISVETNNRPWFSIRNMLDSALASACREPRPHVNILLHPFRDGAKRHVGDVERIVAYMTARGYHGVPIASALSAATPTRPRSFIYCPFDDGADLARPPRHRAWSSWWIDRARYQQRIWRLFAALESRGSQPALCLQLPDAGARYAVYPNVPSGPLNQIERDPLDDPDTMPWDTVRSDAVNVFVPGAARALARPATALLPQAGRDLTGLVPEVALRVAYRLTPDRHLF